MLPDLWDVVIVGAGPAGSMAALRLARRGRRVLVLDRRAFPRDKACGDALIPDAIRSLRRNALYDRVAARAHGVPAGAVYSPSRIAFDVGGEFLTMPRRELDAELLAAATEAGAEFRRGAVARIEQGADAVAVDPAGGPPVRARFAIVATGASVALVRQLGLLERPAPSAVALRAYLRGRPGAALDRLVISFDRSILPGYAWIFPLGGDRYNVGCGVLWRDAAKGGAGDGRDGRDDGGAGAPGADLRPMLARFLATFPAARALGLDASADAAAARGALLRCGLTGTRPGAGRVLVAGETIGATFPLTGEGIGKAMETAELASDAVDQALDAGDPAPLGAYEDRLRAELAPRYAGYEQAERWIARPWVNDLVARRARGSRRLRAMLEGVLQETVAPHDILARFPVLALARRWLR